MDDMNKLLDIARRHKASDADREAQRRSFAYGNTRIENEHITRCTIDEAAEKLVTRRAIDEAAEKPGAPSKPCPEDHR